MIYYFENCKSVKFFSKSIKLFIYFFWVKVSAFKILKMHFKIHEFTPFKCPLWSENCSPVLALRSKSWYYPTFEPKKVWRKSVVAVMNNVKINQFLVDFFWYYTLKMSNENCSPVLALRSKSRYYPTFEPKKVWRKSVAAVNSYVKINHFQVGFFLVCTLQMSTMSRELFTGTCP